MNNQNNLSQHVTELIATRGISNSGKSTWAKKWVAQDPANRCRVNRDDIRAALFTTPDYSTEQEEIVSLAQQAAVRLHLVANRSVIVDDMHLQPRYVRVWFDLAEELGVEFNALPFPITLEEALKRAKKRAAEGGLEVPEAAIRRMYKQTDNGRPRPLPDFSEKRGVSKERVAAYEAASSVPYEEQEGLPKVAIVDVDGTLTMGIHPSRGPFEWTKVGVDEPNPYVIQMVKLLADAGTKIIVFSGRSDACYDETLAWFQQHDSPAEALFMRKDGDMAPDNIVKSELFEREIRGRYNVVAVIDDRGSVCRLWHKLQLPLFRVGDPFSDF